jgi:hypothetical protein
MNAKYKDSLHHSITNITKPPTETMYCMYVNTTKLTKINLYTAEENISIL